MSRNETIRRLLALVAPDLGEDPRAPLRVAARIAWVRETASAWRVAMKRADDAWMALVANLPEDDDDEEEEDLLPPARAGGSRCPVGAAQRGARA